MIAGIGAGFENDCGECRLLNIYGGTIKATGGLGGAGIGGSRINSANMGNILNDGTAYYIAGTNTLVLTNATIEVQKYNPSLAAAIRYNERSDNPFTIQLTGTNKIVDETPDDGVYEACGILLTDAADRYVFDNSGTFKIEMTAGDSSVVYRGIRTGKSVAVNKSSVSIDIPGTAETRAAYIHIPSGSTRIICSSTVRKMPSGQKPPGSSGR